MLGTFNIKCSLEKDRAECVRVCTRMCLKAVWKRSIIKKRLLWHSSWTFPTAAHEYTAEANQTSCQPAEVPSSLQIGGWLTAPQALKNFGDYQPWRTVDVKLSYKEYWSCPRPLFDHSICFTQKLCDRRSVKSTEREFWVLPSGMSREQCDPVYKMRGNPLHTMKLRSGWLALWGWWRLQF